MHVNFAWDAKLEDFTVRSTMHGHHWVKDESPSIHFKSQLRHFSSLTHNVYLVVCGQLHPKVNCTSWKRNKPQGLSRSRCLVKEHQQYPYSFINEVSSVRKVWSFVNSNLARHEAKVAVAEGQRRQCASCSLHHRPDDVLRYLRADEHQRPRPLEERRQLLLPRRARREHVRGDEEILVWVVGQGERPGGRRRVPLHPCRVRGDREVVEDSVRVATRERVPRFVHQPGAEQVGDGQFLKYPFPNLWERTKRLLLLSLSMCWAALVGDILHCRQWQTVAHYQQHKRHFLLL